MTNNHPANGPVSLDRLHQISEILSKASAQSDGGNLGYAMADAVKVIDGAISAFGAEPVAWRWFHLNQWHVTNDEERARDLSWDSVKVTPLYAAPPAPVVPTFDEWLAIRGDKPLGWVKDAMRESYDACRAVMLHGKSDGKPELTVWYGAMPETNGKTNWTAILHRKGQQIWEGITIDRSEYPDRVRYEADRMRHLIGELPDEPDILSYDADAHSGYVKPGNSPVTPDGYVLVPNKLTADNGAKGVLSGEFSETKFINCPECFGDDECETCDGSGRIEIAVPVSWTTIKAIWAKGVEHFAAAPLQEVK